MDAGSRSGEVAAAGSRPAPPWARATYVWMFMMVVETASGYTREVFVAPVVGALRARQLGVLVGSGLVVLIAWVTARWIAARSRRERLLVGAYWVTLTLTFEMGLGRAMGQSWSELFAGYNPVAGGFMLLGLAVMFIAPLLTATGLPRETR